MSEPHAKPRRWWKTAIKLAIVVLVCFAVQGTVRDALGKLREHTWELDYGWLTLAAVLYAAAWLPVGWFWGNVLGALGQPIHRLEMLRAYFAGHLGKYVPGKALVVVIRIGLLKSRAISIRLGVASVLLETLTMMSVGAVLAAATAPFVLAHDRRLAVAAVITAVIVGLPTIPVLTRRLIRRLTSLRVASDPADESSQEDQAVIRRQINARLLAKGWIAAVACWIMLGWSMWATLRAIGVTTVTPFADLPFLVSVVSISIVAGFISMLPGGFGVRDVAILELLATMCGDADALVAAVLWRMVSLLAEVGVCGILEIAYRMRVRTRAASDAAK